MPAANPLQFPANKEQPNPGPNLQTKHILQMARLTNNKANINPPKEIKAPDLDQARLILFHPQPNNDLLTPVTTGPIPQLLPSKEPEQAARRTVPKQRALSAE